MPGNQLEEKISHMFSQGTRTNKHMHIQNNQKENQMKPAFSLSFFRNKWNTIRKECSD